MKKVVLIFSILLFSQVSQGATVCIPENVETKVKKIVLREIAGKTYISYTLGEFSEGFAPVEIEYNLFSKVNNEADLEAFDAFISEDKKDLFLSLKKSSDLFSGLTEISATCST